MEVSVERDDDAVWVSVTGRMDGATAPEFRERVKAAQERDDRFFALDMTDLTFISSAGLRIVLLLAKYSASNGGKTVLFGLSQTIREAFRISGFDKILPIAEDRKAAQAALGTDGGGGR